MQNATRADVDRLIIGGRIRKRRRDRTRLAVAAVAVVLVGGGAYAVTEFDRGDSEDSGATTVPTATSGPTGPATLPPPLPKEPGGPASYPGAMLSSSRTILAAVAMTAVVGLPGVAHAGPAREYAGHAVQATNAAREANDRKPFKVDDCLRNFARKQARAMASKGEIYHQDLGPIMEACHLVSVGENVAYGFATGRSVVNEGWMQSEGHRANILNRGFRLVAVAARRDDQGRWYAAQVLGRR